MKLIIQIPCYNEEKTLPLTIKDLPKQIGGIDKIEVLVINDGSTDRTAEVARELKVDKVVTILKNTGLAYAFKAGIDTAIGMGADIIVNTDGDNQYRGDDIKLLVDPILKGRAHIVVGCRNISQIGHFSPVKKLLQAIGSRVVRKFSNTEVRDVTSGFRAYSKEAALKINIFSDYTYTLESIIQAGRNNMAIECVDIGINSKLRESRLIKSTLRYVLRSAITILRIYLMYEPLKSFLAMGMLSLSCGAILVARFFVYHFTRATGGGHVQSLIIASVLILCGFGIMVMGLIGDIIAANRKIGEEILYRVKKNR